MKHIHSKTDNFHILRNTFLTPFHFTKKIIIFYLRTRINFEIIRMYVSFKTFSFSDLKLFSEWQEAIQTFEHDRFGWIAALTTFSFPPFKWTWLEMRPMWRSTWTICRSIRTRSSRRIRLRICGWNSCKFRDKQIFCWSTWIDFDLCVILIIVNNVFLMCDCVLYNFTYYFIFSNKDVCM